MRIPTRWHAEARRLRADGLTPIEIAVLLGRAVSSVRSALGPASQEKAAGKRRPSPSRPRPSRREVFLVGWRRDEAAWRRDEVSQAARALAAAAAAFAAGEIDRAELMRQISR